MRKLLAFLTLVACLGCANPVAPQVPEGAREFTPPPVYTTWIAEVEACVGRHYPFEKITWWTVDVAGWSWTSPRGNEQWINGLQRGKNIYLSSWYIMDRTLVKHEWLHVLGFVHGDEAVYPWPFDGCATEP